MLIKSKTLSARIARRQPAAGASSLSPESEAYLGALKRRNCSPKTIRSYRLELMRIERVIKRPMVEATGLDFDGFLNWLAARDVRACTINKSINVMRSFDKWAVRMDVIPSDRTVKLEKAKEEKRLPKRPTDEDIRLFITYMDGQTSRIGLRDRAMLLCLYYLGGRASEVTGLDVEAIDLDKCVVRLFGKGRKERYVPIVPALAEIIRAWLAVHPTGSGAMFVHLSKAKMGERLTYDGLRHAFIRRTGQAGIGGKGYTAHKFRHAFATTALRNGVSLDKIQKLLGHSSVATTQIYAATELGAEVASQLAGAL